MRLRLVDTWERCRCNRELGQAKKVMITPCLAQNLRLSHVSAMEWARAADAGCLGDFLEGSVAWPMPS
jgi:hypothetical protein